VLLALPPGRRQNQSSYMTWKEARRRPSGRGAAAGLPGHFRAADKLRALGPPPLLGRMYLPAYRAGTELVADLRRRYPPGRVLPALYGCGGMVTSSTSRSHRAD